MNKKKDYTNLILFTALAYGIGYFGFFLWFVLGCEVAGFVAIIAPATAYFLLRLIRKDIVKVNFKNISVRIILLSVCVPILYTSVCVIIYMLLKGNLSTDKFSLQTLIILVFQWIFAGFFEEVGWRGFLFPTLKKWNKSSVSYIICGLIWSGWHLPMILSGTIMTSWSYPVGILMLAFEGIIMSIIIDKLMQLTKMSIWTCILFHAAHNVIMQLLLAMIPKNAYYLLDDGGLLSQAVLAVTAIILICVTRKNGTNQKQYILH